MSDLCQPEILRTVIESLRVGLYMVDRDLRIVLWNDGAEHITGYLRQDVIGRHCNDRILDHCGHNGRLLCGVHSCPLTEAMHQGSPREAYIFLQHKRGHRIPVHVWAVPIRDTAGVVIGAAETFEEEYHHPIADPGLRAENLAVHRCLDLSCEVPNHIFTRSHIREQLAIFAEHGLPFGVLCVSLQEFSRLKSTCGRPGAEAALRMVVGTIKHYIGPGDFVGRWADNEFLAILSGCTQAQLQDVGDSIKKIVDQSEIVWWGDPLSFSVSVGVGMVKAGDTVESLLRRVEQTSTPTPEGAAAPCSPRKGVNG
jgi:PAS domain S-box-containing protein/diguanylate cyclase (GGDEF)-like protein